VGGCGRTLTWIAHTGLHPVFLCRKTPFSGLFRPAASSLAVQFLGITFDSILRRASIMPFLFGWTVIFGLKSLNYFKMSAHVV
jgi:hypothetical protein